MKRTTPGQPVVIEGVTLSPAQARVVRHSRKSGEVFGAWGTLEALERKGIVSHPSYKCMIQATAWLSELGDRIRDRMVPVDV